MKNKNKTKEKYRNPNEPLTKKEKIMNIVKEYAPYVIIALVIIIIRTYFYTPVLVSGSSMDNTLENGDLLILDKISLKKGIKRFDIVVIDGSPVIIKRVIGLPGESVAYYDGQLYINKRKVEEHYGLNTTKDFDEVFLKENEYFVLGDNRLVSKDSRVTGPVKISDIKGKTVYRFFPFSKVGRVDNDKSDN